MEAKPILITNPTNIRYLTGFISVEPRDAYLLLCKEKRFLFTNALYKEGAKQIKNIVLIEISREHPFSRELALLCEKESIQTLEFEETDLTNFEYELLNKTLTHTSLIPIRGRIEEKRMIKRDDEIALIRRATTLTDECFSTILQNIAIGVTESEIAWEIESFFRKNGAQNAFSPIVAFGKNSSKPHHVPSNTVLENNQGILLDFGARVSGYCADMTRMVFIGTPKKQWKNAYASLLQAQQKTIELLQNGERDGKVLDDACRSFIGPEYPTYPHSLGHSLGLEVHETPRLTTTAPTVLQNRMVITIEPGIYIEESYGMRIEDTILIWDSGIDILTHTPKELLVI